MILVQTPLARVCGWKNATRRTRGKNDKARKTVSIYCPSKQFLLERGIDEE